jgi:hypothetical protein
VTDLSTRRSAALADLFGAAREIADHYDVCPACLVVACGMSVEQGMMDHEEDRHAADPGEAFDMLVSELAATFKKHFRLTPTVLGPSGQPSTPFIAFAIATCAEFGKVVTAAEISDAGRRRGVPEDR